MGTAVNGVLLLLAALGGEWIVHQVQYLLLYGSRFGGVMGATPHRYYMRPVGLGLAASALLLLSVVAVLLALYGLRRARLLGLLPARMRRSVPARWPRLRWGALLPTALMVAWIQTAVYVSQENAEAHAQGLPWPGLGVLFPAHYPIALPLDLLVAVCVSFVLWSLSLLLRRSREGVRAARLLVALFCPPSVPARRLVPFYAYIPSRRPVAGILGLRAPPVAA